MNWQQAVSLGIVALTAAIFLWAMIAARLRPRKLSFARNHTCGCSSPDRSASHASILFRARRGERPQILVRSDYRTPVRREPLK